MDRVLHALAVVLFVCLGVRLGAWLVEPVLPALCGLVFLVAIAYGLLVGFRTRDGR
jgi:hypothetical protein